MIVAAVVCPHPPLLLRELSGAQDAVPDLRAACARALTEALTDGVDTVVVVGGADTGEEWSPSLVFDVSRFGATAAPAPGGLPLSLGVGRRLLQKAGWTGPMELRSVAWEAGGSEVTETALEVVGRAERGGRTLLVVLGDGSARRGDKAPGYLDDCAYAFDARIGEALRAGDATVLRDLDPLVAVDLLVLGRAAFAVLGAAVAGAGLRASAEVLHSADPYGVQYTVALWRTASRRRASAGRDEERLRGPRDEALGVVHP